MELPSYDETSEFFVDDEYMNYSFSYGDRSATGARYYKINPETQAIESWTRYVKD
jgi:hypothetical protein